jgi:hypothetical protein
MTTSELSGRQEPWSRRNEGARNYFAIPAALWILTLVLWFHPGVVVPDGAGYVSYLPSTWLDRDFVFFDQWARFGLIRDGLILHKEVTATSHLGNHWTSGSALFWYPWFVSADALRPLVSPQLARDGVSLPYNVAVVFGSAVAGLLTLALGFHIARPYARAGAAAIAACGAWLGTPLLWYSVVHGTMSHAVSAFACAAVFALALKLRHDRSYETLILAGLAVGLATAVRPQNAPFVVVPLMVAQIRDPRRLLIFGGSALLATFPQLIASTAIYGNPFAFVTGISAPPFAPFQRIWTWEPLISWYHGLFPWSPFAALGTAGLILLWRRDRSLAFAALFVLATQWFVNATLERSFWGAWSFGPRRFDNCTIVFLLGAAVLIDRLRPVVAAALVGATSLWTMSIFLAALGGLDLGAYYTPSELVQWQWKGLTSTSISFMGGVPPPARATVLQLLGSFGALSLAVAFLIRALARYAARIAVVYFTALALFFSVCASGGDAVIERWQPVIDLNLRLAELPGGPATRFALLEDEIRYLRKAGRQKLAQQTERELEELIEKRREAAGSLR